jgi:hypothetical protein
MEGAIDKFKEAVGMEKERVSNIPYQSLSLAVPDT